VTAAKQSPQKELAGSFTRLVFSLQRMETEYQRMEQEINWVKDVLAEFGYDGPLVETCCPLREMLTSAKPKPKLKRKAKPK